MSATSHKDITTSLAVDSATLSELVRLSTERGRPVGELLAAAVAQYATPHRSGPATVVEVSPAAVARIAASTTEEVAYTRQLMAETTAALLAATVLDIAS